MKTADVFVNIPVKSIARAYTYRVPQELAKIEAGWRVFVPFGSRKVEGFVVETHELAEAPEKIKLKDIIAAVDEECWFSPQMIEIARWLSEFYLCSLAEIMRLFMPGKSGLRITVLYEADESQQDHMLLAMPGCRAIYDYLRREGPQKKAAIVKALPEWQADVADFLEKMQKYHIVRKVYEAQKRDAAQYEKFVALCGEVTPQLLEDYRRKKAQVHLLNLLQQTPEIPLASLKAQHVSLATVHNLEAAGLAEIRRRRVLRDSYRDAKALHEAVELTEDQRQVVARVYPSIDAARYQGFLLKGVTGSGKTQVYIELAERVRAAGRRVIVLVPEIALTGQVVMAFKAYFPDDLVVMHSRLSLAERNDAILRVRRNEAGII
ncbi:MAG: DEAD/DEAH box helicase family protein, partial [Mitsuokella jalaludinii]|nr:DEAD/DEAH box helicase family protein [Mitsuokella jalaludinii]